MRKRGNRVRIFSYSIMAALGFGLAASSVNAATFTNEAIYLGSAGAQTVIDFEGIAPNNSFSPLGTSLTLSGVTFSVSSGTLGVADANAGNVAGNPYDSSILFSNNDAPITASLGSNVFSVAGNFGDLSGISPSASVSIFGSSGLLDSLTFLAPDLAPGQPGAFVGFTSNEEITSLVFSGVSAWEGLDNFSFGGSVSQIPLPASLPLFLAALGGLFMFRRRQAG